jgi:diguanylate cyclase (GGDEF)-like protein
VTEQNELPRFPDILPSSIEESYFHRFEEGDIVTEQDVQALIALMYDHPEREFYFLAEGGRTPFALGLAINRGDILKVETQFFWYRHPTIPHDYVHIEVRDGNYAWDWEREVVEKGPTFARIKMRLSERKSRELEVNQKIAAERKSAQRAMREDELELDILKRFVAHHEAAELAHKGQTDKHARELDMRDVLRDLTGIEGTALEYVTHIWLQRLVRRPSNEGQLLPLRPCSDTGSHPDHKYHARAYLAPGRTPAWDRIRELETTIGQSRPVTPKREFEQKFRILWSAGQALHDFNEWTKQGRATDISVGVLFVDIDHFGALNGRSTENMVDKTILPDFQRLLAQLVRHRGEAYRHGGEEFIILLPNHTTGEIKAFADRLLGIITDSVFTVGDETVRLTVSIGVAWFPDHGDSYDVVLQAANNAKRTAKQQGRNRVVTVSAHPQPGP